MDKGKIKKALRKALEIKTIIFVILVSCSLLYYARCFCKNQVLTFGKNNSVILLGLLIMTLWSFAFCIFLLYENKKLLKVIISKNDIIVQQNETIQGLLNQVIDKTNTIEENTDDILMQNEDNLDQIIRSSKITREILLDDRSDKIA